MSRTRETIMNLSEILGALKEFNEPYREAQDRLETMPDYSDKDEIDFGKRQTNK